MGNLFYVVLFCYVALLEKIKYHIDQIRQALMDAGLDPRIIREFLESQVEVVKQVNLFNKEQPNRNDYIINEIKMTEIHLLKDILDPGDQFESIDQLTGIPEIECSAKIKKALNDTSIDHKTIHEFLESQLEVFQEVNRFNKKEFSKDEYNRNELKIKQVKRLRDLLA